MADNVQITPGSGANIATDDVGGVQYQRVKVNFGAEGQATDVSPANPLPVTSPSDFPDTGSLAELQAIHAALTAGIPVSGQFWQTTQPVSANALPLPNGASTEATLAQAVSALAALLTELQAKTEPDLDLLTRIALKIIARMTYSTNGLRVDASGATITANIAAAQTLATLTTLAGIAQNTQNGQGVQLSHLDFQQSFRRNLVVT